MPSFFASSSLDGSTSDLFQSAGGGFVCLDVHPTKRDIVLLQQEASAAGASAPGGAVEGEHRIGRGHVSIIAHPFKTESN
jgi:hypothetical protein